MRNEAVACQICHLGFVYKHEIIFDVLHTFFMKHVSRDAAERMWIFVLLCESSRLTCVWMQNAYQLRGLSVDKDKFVVKSLLLFNEVLCAVVLDILMEKTIRCLDEPFTGPSEVFLNLCVPGVEFYIHRNSVTCLAVSARSEVNPLVAVATLYVTCVLHTRVTKVLTFLSGEF